MLDLPEALAEKMPVRPLSLIKINNIVRPIGETHYQTLLYGLPIFYPYTYHTLH